MNDDERIGIALAALAEVTDVSTVGPLVGASVPVPGVVDLRFTTTQPGYVGWFWTVSTSAVDGVTPTVLELQMQPGDGALVAPPWTPWEERLADWRRAHPGGLDAEDGLEPDEDEDEDDLDGDESDLDDEPVDDVLDDAALERDAADDRRD